MEKNKIITIEKTKENERVFDLIVDVELKLKRLKDLISSAEVMDAELYASKKRQFFEFQKLYPEYKEKSYALHSKGFDVFEVEVDEPEKHTCGHKKREDDPEGLPCIACLFGKISKGFAE